MTELEPLKFEYAWPSYNKMRVPSDNQYLVGEIKTELNNYRVKFYKYLENEEWRWFYHWAGGYKIRVVKGGLLADVKIRHNNADSHFGMKIYPRDLLPQYPGKDPKTVVNWMLDYYTFQRYEIEYYVTLAKNRYYKQSIQTAEDAAALFSL